MTKNKITGETVDRVCAVVENYGLDKPRLCAALEALTPEPDEQVAALEDELAATYAKLVRTADLLRAERERCAEVAGELRRMTHMQPKFGTYDKDALVALADKL